MSTKQTKPTPPRRLALAAIALLAVAAWGTAACSALRKGSELTYGQVQAIQPGLTAAQVIDSFGEPGRRERRADGSIALLDYAALDARMGHARLILGFDDREVLRDKRFTGAVLRP